MNAVTYQSDWSSDLRTTAIALQTLVDVTPDHPYVGKMARYLVDKRGPDGRYRTTQESAFALMALTEVVRIREKDAPDFVARVLLGGHAGGRGAEFHGRSMDVRRTVLPMTQLPAMGTRSALDFVRDGGQGSLSYTAVLRYAPAEMPRNAARPRAGRPAVDRALRGRWTAPVGARRASWCGSGCRVGTPAARSNVALEIPLPAGLEAVDTSLSTTARLPRGERGGGHRRPRRREDARRGRRAALGLRVLESLQPHRAPRRPGAVLLQRAAAGGAHRLGRRPGHDPGRLPPGPGPRRGDVRAGGLRPLRRRRPSRSSTTGRSLAGR